MSGVRLIADWSDIDRELDRVGRMPDPATVARLEAGLVELFGFSQDVVHVITASLKESGKHESSTDRLRHRWEGNITYGGPSTGVNNPVDYAIYEQARDDAHDFMAPVIAASDRILGGAMEGGLG